MECVSSEGFLKQRTQILKKVCVYIYAYIYIYTHTYIFHFLPFKRYMTQLPATHIHHLVFNNVETCGGA